MSNQRAVVIHNFIPMRARPDSKSERVSEAILGEMVKVLTLQGDYAQVETPDAYQGWVKRRHILNLPEGTQYPKSLLTREVKSLLLPVLKKPEDTSERITLLTIGTLVELADEVDKEHPHPPYTLLRLPNGQTGYVKTDDLTYPLFLSKQAQRYSPIEYAKMFIGVPYVWGGRTTFGIDCSGFTQKVYSLVGHVLPRDAYMQAVWSGIEIVDRNALQAGDLIFFSGAKDPRKRGVTHVGMALGEGRFIHASGDNGVGITPVSDPFYTSEFHSAGRVKAYRAEG